MNANINVKQINKFFNLKNNQNKNSGEKKIRKNKTKVIVNDFFSINEINICEIVQHILYYSNYYDMLIDYDFIKIGQLGKKLVENIYDEDTDYNDTFKKKYFLFQYKNENSINFDDFLFNLKTPKQFIFYVLDSYSYLLTGLIKLNENNICFFNLSPENIVFNKENGEKPLLQNFGLSLAVSQLNEEYITNIIKKTKYYTYKPLEIHILFYLIENNINTISYSFIENICEVFIDNMHILSLFSPTYREKYKLSCINYLKTYINKPRNIIINDILQYCNTWDNYSLSIIYLHIFGNILRVFSLKETIISKIVLELLKNIHPEPLKREKLTKTLANYEKLYYDFSDWPFINLIPQEKLTKLYETLLE